MIKLDVIIKCPYCGFDNKVTAIENGWALTKLATCDVDSGGCDKDFVYKVRLIPEIETFSLRKSEDADN